MIMKYAEVFIGCTRIIMSRYTGGQQKHNSSAQKTKILGQDTSRIFWIFFRNEKGEMNQYLYAGTRDDHFVQGKILK